MRNALTRVGFVDETSLKAFAKPKAPIRRAAAGTYEALWQVIRQACHLLTEEEYYNFFRAAGYETD